MKVEQLYTSCLAEATYYIASGEEAAIIDPLRETAPYIAMAKADGVKIKYIFLTHFHADFVSGHVDLAKETGATIIYGPTAKADFNFHEAKDNELFAIGNIQIQVLHTPGHTLESSSFLLYNEVNKPYCLFSGDTLFIGDVGRPDLAVTSDITKEDLAAKLYDSLRNKIMILPNDVIIYPNHGKGSACGKNMSSETYDTLGNQKKTNYALDASLSKEDFVSKVLEGLQTPPAYFPKNAQMNKQINKDVSMVIAQGLSPITVDKYQHHLSLEDVLLLDVRSPSEFATRHIPNSLFLGLDGTFAPWVGALVENINQAIILIAPKGREEEAVVRLSRIGYDNILGFIDGGVDSWEEAGLTVSSVTSVEATSINLPVKDTTFVDVRKPGEYEENYVIDSKHLPLSNLSNSYDSLDKNGNYYVYCAGGYRSMIAISILKRNGFEHLINIEKGFKAIKETMVPLFKCKNNCATCACSS